MDKSFYNHTKQNTISVDTVLPGFYKATQPYMPGIYVLDFILVILLIKTLSKFFKGRK